MTKLTKSEEKTIKVMLENAIESQKRWAKVQEKYSKPVHDLPEDQLTEHQKLENMARRFTAPLMRPPFPRPLISKDGSFIVLNDGITIIRKDGHILHWAPPQN